jgi:hypothetical protein
VSAFEKNERPERVDSSRRRAPALRSLQFALTIEAGRTTRNTMRILLRVAAVATVPRMMAANNPFWVIWPTQPTVRFAADCGH